MTNVTRPLPEYKPAGQSGLENGDIAEVPIGLDPEHHRIILRHWFGQVGTVADLGDVTCPARLAGDT